MRAHWSRLKNAALVEQRRVAFLGSFPCCSCFCWCAMGPGVLAARIRNPTVLAGSELEDLSSMFDQIQASTGVRLEIQYTGSLDGAERLMAGEAFDLAWFSHGKYLSLLQGANKRILAQGKIMLSPVILGVKESKATAWDGVTTSTSPGAILRRRRAVENCATP